MRTESSIGKVEIEINHLWLQMPCRRNQFFSLFFVQKHLSGFSIDHELPTIYAKPDFLIYETVRPLLAPDDVTSKSVFEVRKRLKTDFDVTSSGANKGSNCAKSFGICPTLSRTPSYQGSMDGPQATFWDTQLINKMYKCTDKCAKQMPCWNGGVTDGTSCSKCFCPKGWAGTYCETRPTNAQVISVDTTVQKV
ncbi:hypothetical protein PRIPAC_98075 [Pristionchus pacificus]|uniref:Uncharacterized protein n=1 Tax=Pristionchus pacificus TaxID=54126 RepID=A0A2A6D1X7_PRIPA|nr:hypothetical protein PRIPAC_98075 [Pristionchus pacificus]|eukprot:PDM84388.1 hypothetical protein PRIPAC_33411 [Pristionchus pacificus]